MSDAPAPTPNRHERRAGAAVARKTEAERLKLESDFAYLFGIFGVAAVKVLPHRRAATVQSVVGALHKLASVASFAGKYPSFTLWTLCKRFRGLGNGKKAKAKYEGEPHRQTTKMILLELEGLGLVKFGDDFWRAGNPATRGSMGRSVSFDWAAVKALAAQLGITAPISPRKGMTKGAKWIQEKARFARNYALEAKAKALQLYRAMTDRNQARYTAGRPKDDLEIQAHSANALAELKRQAAADKANQAARHLAAGGKAPLDTLSLAERFGLRPRPGPA